MLKLKPMKRQSSNKLQINKILLFFIFSLFLLLTACNDNDHEILAFFDDLDMTTNLMLEKIEAGDIDGARLIFDAQKENLKSGWKKIGRSRGGRSVNINMSPAVKERYIKSFSPNIQAIRNSAVTFQTKFGKDKIKIEKLDILIEEHGAIFR
ncbi:MAG TPA: hypothetical protein PKE69_10950 [Pyrinomonadaceae bacterium]|nr:hypothetical protein [Pyrinomonadaceae bacterium]